jgi:hypothetical protein
MGCNVWVDQVTRLEGGKSEVRILAGAKIDFSLLQNV